MELVIRLVQGGQSGYVRRGRAGEDKCEVLLSLTPKVDKVLQTLSWHHRTEVPNAGAAPIDRMRRVMAGRTGGSGQPEGT